MCLFFFFSLIFLTYFFFFFSSRRRHTRLTCDWSSDVCSSDLLGLAFRRDSRRLVSASADGTVRQWDVATGQEVAPPYERHTGEVVTAAYSPDGNWIASGGTDRTVRVWAASNRHDLTVLDGHTGTV